MKTRDFGYAINATAEADTEPGVRLHQDPGGRWELHRDGLRYEVRGAGGHEHLELLRELGGNTLRTWSTEPLEAEVNGEKLLDQAHRLGLSAMVGIWLAHPRHGADYGDPHFLQTQRQRVRESVRHYRDHPAVLMWGLGNEMEESGEDLRVWRELEVLAQIVKAEDPHHPICTAIAGTDHEKVAKIKAYYPSLDILGINIYGGARTVVHALAEQDWTGPYLLTEFGPAGHWEVPATSWGAPIEPSAAAKASAYAAAHSFHCSAASGQCLGTFSFLWGHKQETTATWFGMFLATGEKTPAVDAMRRLWTGEEPAYPAPVLHELQADFREASVTAGSEHEVRAELDADDLTDLTFEWQVVAETHDRRSGGDAEEAPPVIPGCVSQDRGNRVRIRIPDTPGAYRVFLYVRNGKGGGAGGNFPFYAE